jgi:hypothetical protein
MIRLVQAEAHTRLESTLCAACPQGSLGCCVSPPELGWADVGRIVSRGGRDWILAELAAGNLQLRPDGLAIRRVRRRESALVPRRLKCVYHGGEGCTIPPDRRSATCNYFLCADAFAEGGEARGEPVAARARDAHATLRTRYTRWDRDLAARLGAVWPERATWDAAFLDWLGTEFDAEAARERGWG